MIEGNGAGKTDVLAHDMGGWVVFRPARVESRRSPELPAALRWALQEFFDQRRQLRLVAVTAVDCEGTTVELIAIYELAFFPRPTPAPGE